MEVIPMNFQKIFGIFLFFTMSSGFALFGMDSNIQSQPSIKTEKLHDDQLYEEILDLLKGKDQSNLKLESCESIEKLFSLNDQGPLFSFIMKKLLVHHDKKTLFFSFCRAFNRFLLSTSSRLRTVFLRLANHGIDVKNQQDPLSAFFNKLHDDFKDFFEEEAFKKYLVQWNQALIKERLTFSMPKTKNESQQEQSHGKSTDVEAVSEGDIKELINAGGAINVNLKKGTITLVCDSGSKVVLKKIDPETMISVDDQEFLGRLKKMFVQEPDVAQESKIFEEDELVEKNEKPTSLKKVIRDNLSWIAPWGLLTVLGGVYCCMEMPVTTLLTVAGVFYVTRKCEVGIRELYDEVTRSNKKESVDQKTKK